MKLLYAALKSYFSTNQETWTKQDVLKVLNDVYITCMEKELTKKERKRK